MKAELLATFIYGCFKKANLFTDYAVSTDEDLPVISVIKDGSKVTVSFVTGEQIVIEVKEVNQSSWLEIFKSAAQHLSLG